MVMVLNLRILQQYKLYRTIKSALNAQETHFPSEVVLEFSRKDRVSGIRI